MSVAESTREISKEGVLMGTKKPLECFSRSHGCEWVNREPKCPHVEACKAKDKARNGKSDCTNCIVRDQETFMEGYDPATPEFAMLKRFASQMIEEWCADCKAYGYGKWQRTCGL